MIPNPSIQVDPAFISISSSGEVKQQTQFWDTGLKWDSGLYWDNLLEVIGAPSIQVDTMSPAIQVT